MASSDDFVGVVAVLVIFGLPITYAIVNRVLAHQERLEMLKHGVVPPPDPKWAKRMGKAGWYDPSAYNMPPGAPGMPLPPGGMPGPMPGPMPVPTPSSIFGGTSIPTPGGAPVPAPANPGSLPMV